jgi:hypothetical protein
MYVEKSQNLDTYSSFKKTENRVTIGGFVIVIFLILNALIVPSLLGMKVYAQSNQTSSLSETGEGNDIGGPNNQSLVPTVKGDTKQGSSKSSSKPDGDCLFNPDLSKCAPDENGNCPEGFGRNEDNQCFPIHNECPDGYHGHEDDESGRCIPDSIPCILGYIMSPDFPTCEYKDSVCEKHPDLDECQGNPTTTPEDNQVNSRVIKSAFDSGYKHGCNDATIANENKRYINQPGKGPAYHTSEFMNGYLDGFADCIKPENQSPVADAGPKKREVFEGQTITLDAGNSYDPDGKIIKYEWRNGVNAEPGCPYGTFINKYSSTPQFTAPSNVPKDCSNWYEVIVTDNDSKRGVDAILVTVKQL